MSDDGHRPHQYPRNAPAEVIAWTCGACGAVVREFGPRDETPCPVDWRSKAAGVMQKLTAPPTEETQ